MARVPTARAPTIEPVSDKTRHRCSWIRADRLTRKRGALSVPVWGCLGTSRAVAVSRTGCSQKRGEIPRTRNREISHSEIWRRDLWSEGRLPKTRTAELRTPAEPHGECMVDGLALGRARAAATATAHQTSRLGSPERVPHRVGLAGLQIGRAVVDPGCSRMAFLDRNTSPPPLGDLAPFRRHSA